MSYVPPLVPLTLVLLVPFSVEWAVPTTFHEGEVSTSPCMVFDQNPSHHMGVEGAKTDTKV